jgi:small subunit ribosomal protein S4e
MTKSHLKRLSSPRTWPIAKKTLTFIARPFPGPHKISHQVPITVFLRDMVKIANTTKEVKRILHLKKCLIDGTVAHDNKRPAGLFDIISLPEAELFYSIGINGKNKLYPISITEKESKQKISKVMNKTSLKGGKTQLNTLDGRSILVDDAAKYSVGDSLIISLPDQKVVDSLPMKEGAIVVLDAGSHVGIVGSVKAIDGTTMVVKTNDKVFSTKRKYAVVIGKDKPIITL